MGETVTVACADPKGIILRVEEFVDVQEPMFGGGYRTVKQSREVGRITLNGYWGNYPKDARPTQSLRMNYGITRDVDKGLFEQWIRGNKENPLVKNMVVFAVKDVASAEARAKEMVGELRHKGADPLDPTMLTVEGRIVPKDPRYPRGPMGVQTADRSS